jgi:hypothetical protein
MDAITAQLAAAVGLDGRGRVASGAVERARSTVTHGIKAALRNIHRSLPALADEPALRLTTGTFCVYTPDPGSPDRLASVEHHPSRCEARLHASSGRR